MNARKNEHPAESSENKRDELQTEGPVGERDEVKKAEERTQKLQEKANDRAKDK
jgi:hypothetical protein